MDEDPPFAGDPADSREAIMRATFVALQRHGYAGLSIQRIADEADLSKSTFYHHFDDKEDLLVSFVEFILEAFRTVLSLESDDGPRETLETVLDHVLTEDYPSVEADASGGAEEWDILEAYVEVRSQAVRNEDFRVAFSRIDEQLLEQFTTLFQEGIDRGQFRDVDPEEVARTILALLFGHIFGVATSDEADADAIREELDHYLQARVYAE